VTVFKHFEDSLGVIVKTMVKIEVKNGERGGGANGVNHCAAEKVVRI
jgi:hypothetical protein